MRITELRLKGIGPFRSDTTLLFPKGTRDDLADVYLLVGQNGCGKTTALHALASLISPNATAPLNLYRRWSAPLDADPPFVIARNDLGTTWVAVGVGDTSTPEKQHEAIKLAAGCNAPSLFASQPQAMLFGQPRAPVWWDYVMKVNNNTSSPTPWAAFSYAGARTVQDTRIDTIAELKQGPLQGSLGFSATADSQRLAQWIANQDVFRHRANDAGDKKRAEQIQESVSRIEAAVAEIIGAEFAFQLNSRDLNVRVKLNGSVLDFGLLPEGVKSIVSWIGDLLMRLDRIEWTGDVPVLQREFLLLLDEIDVHLHPAWQRKVLPVVQKLFPKAQIIASTHSPFVVASLADGAVIELRLDQSGRATAQPPIQAPLHMSYSTTLRSLFGISSDFDVDTEKQFSKLQSARERVLSQKDPTAEAEFRQIAEQLRAGGGEEIAQLVQFEVNQLERLRKAAR